MRFPRVSFDGDLEAVVGRYEVVHAPPTRKARNLLTTEDTPESFCTADFRQIPGRGIDCYPELKVSRYFRAIGIGSVSWDSFLFVLAPITAFFFNKLFHFCLIHLFLVFLFPFVQYPPEHLGRRIHGVL